MMKKGICVGVVLMLCLGIFTGCSNSSYVGKWTTTKIREGGKNEKDFQNEKGYKEILTLNADGTYSMERISVDEKKYSEKLCKKWTDDFKKEHRNPKWKVIYSNKKSREGIVFWDDNSPEEPDENDGLDFYFEGEYIKQYGSATYYER